MPASVDGSASRRGSRILFVLLFMVIPGSQILIYPILWILMPAEETVPFQTPSTPPVGAV